MYTSHGFNHLDGIKTSASGAGADPLSFLHILYIILVSSQHSKSNNLIPKLIQIMASKFAILLIGGTGKVCSRIAPILSEAGIPTLLASRSGTAPDIPGVEGVHFNWEDETTYNNPFLKNPNISAIFLVAPRIMNSAPIMKNFIDFAREKNVKRFVLLSASVIPEGGPVMGQVHAYLKSLPVGWAVLQPSWFMGMLFFGPGFDDSYESQILYQNYLSRETDARSENLSEEQHLEPIRDRNEMYSATGAGKIPWVACDDIAAVGFRALADEVPHKAAHLVLGRELLSYTDICSHDPFPKAQFLMFLLRLYAEFTLTI